MGTIAEKLEYTLDSINDIEEALKAKNSEFKGTKGVLEDGVSKKVIGDPISNQIVTVLPNSTIAYDAPDINTSVNVGDILDEYSLEEENIDEENYIVNFRKREVSSDISYSFNFVGGSNEYPMVDDVTLEVPLTAGSALTQTLGAKARSKALSLAQAYAYEIGGGAYTYGPYEIADVEVLDIKPQIRCNIVVRENNTGAEATFAGLVSWKGGTATRSLTISKDVNPDFTIKLSSTMEVTGTLQVTVKTSVSVRWSSGSSSGMRTFTGEAVGTTNITLTNYLTESKILEDQLFSLKIVPTFYYKETIIKTPKLGTYADFILDIGSDSTVSEGNILKNKKTYDPTTGSYIIGSMPNNANSTITKTVNFESGNPVISLNEGYYKDKQKIKLNGTILNDSRRLLYNSNSMLSREYSSGVNSADYDVVFNLVDGEETDFYFFSPRTYKDAYSNQYISSNYYRLHFMYWNKNLFLVPMTPTDTVSIVNNVPDRTYFTICTTGGTGFGVSVNAIIRVDNSTFLILYEYETVVGWSKTSGIYARTIKLEMSDSGSVDDNYTMTGTLSSALLLGNATNTVLSGAAYNVDKLFLFPLKDNVSNIMEIGIGKVYDNYTSAGVHTTRTLLYNDIYRTTSSGALTLNSTAWTTLCSVAPSTTSGYHWCDLFPSKYGGVMYCSQTNVSNYTEKFIYRMNGRGDVKAYNLEINKAGAYKEVEGLIPLGRLKDGNILFYGSTQLVVDKYTGDIVTPIIGDGQYVYLNKGDFYIKSFNDKLRTFCTVGKFDISSALGVYYEDIILMENNILAIKIRSNLEMYQILQPELSNKNSYEYKPYFIGTRSIDSRYDVMPNYSDTITSSVSGIGTVYNTNLDKVGKAFFTRKSDGALCYLGDDGNLVKVSETENEIKSVAYGNGMYVTVGKLTDTFSKIQYTSDHVDWTELGVGGTCNELACSEYRIVGVGDQGQSFSSDDGGITWTPMTGLNPKKDYNSVAYGNGRFVCVGNDGESYYSTDGKTWTPMTGLNEKYKFRSVAYGNGRFICVGADHYAHHSIDGETWERETFIGNSGREGCTSIAYGNSKFVVICDTNIYVTSDGINWNFASTPHSSSGFADYSSVMYGGDRFIAAGEGSKCVYSLDAVTWTAMSGQSTSVRYPSLAYGNGVYVCLDSSSFAATYSTNGTKWVASTGLLPVGSCNVLYYKNRFITINSAGTVYYSTDGVTWSFSNSVSRVEKIIYGKDRFIAVGGISSYEAAYSLDGKTWSGMTGLTSIGQTAASTIGLKDIAYGNNIYVCVGIKHITGDPVKPHYSTDGKTWTASSNAFSTSFQSVAYGNGRFVCVGYYGVSCYSTDGKTWTAMTGLNVNKDYYGVAYGNGRFVCVGEDGAYYSTDGKTWTACTNLKDSTEKVIFTNIGFIISRESVSFKSLDGDIWDEVYINGALGNSELRDIVYANGKYVIVGTDGAYYSTDGKTWTAMTGLNVNKDYYGVTYGNGRFICVGEDGAYYSTDGKTWTLVTGLEININYVYKSVTYNNGYFVIVGKDTDGQSSTFEQYALVCYSSDGVTWESVRFGYRYPLEGVSYVNDRFISVGSNSGVFYSLDGISWEPMTGISVNHTIYDVAYGNGHYVCSGFKYIYYSLDGETWVQGSGYRELTSKHNFSCYYSVAYGNDRFVCVGNDGIVYYSLNGETWVKTDGLSSGVDAYKVRFREDINRFICVGSLGSVFYSLDGETWETGDMRGEILNYLPV